VDLQPDEAVDAMGAALDAAVADAMVADVLWVPTSLVVSTAA